ncbi:MAG: peptidylprolyl isomerase [Planctomycetes bacterium]|nr:peptidylprolyl isomerase [Planctomycetota bacterium]
MIFKTTVTLKTTILLCAICALLGCQKQKQYTIAKTTTPKILKSPIVAIIDTTAIRQEDLWPSLIELGGQEILEDYILKIAIIAELKNEGVKILPKDIQIEEQNLSIVSSNLSENEFDNILKARGFGNYRKSQLLWRNAALRKLVQNQVDITSQAVQRMFSIVHGPAYPTRLIVISTLDEANDVLSDLKRGISFADLAIEKSIDSSASRGGRVNPISTSDPTWPSPIREAISTLELNTISDPIFIGDRWVILEVTDEPTSSNVVFDEVEPEMRRLAIFAQERFLMENLAKSYIQRTRVDIIDLDLQRTSSLNRNLSK